LSGAFSIIETGHWSDPIRALSEETVALEPSRADPRMGSGIRHAVSDRDYQRLMRGEGCHQCLTPFPAPVGLDIRNLAKWYAVTSTEFRWTHTREHGLELVKQGLCPVCGFECSPEAFALNDEGKVDGGAAETPAMQHEIDTFSDRAEAWFKKNAATQRRKAARRKKT
jgi:hypothetical protein